MKRLDTDIFFSIFADHPKRARAWWAVSVQTTDEPFTREYSVENFGTDYLFRVKIRLGFKVSQSIPAYIHQIMHDLEHTGELPQQKSQYPKLDADPGVGTIKYVLIHKALMPESTISQRGALSLQMKYAIRHAAGSPVKWFGLAPYNPLIEVQPLFLSTRRPPRLKREANNLRQIESSEDVLALTKPTAKSSAKSSTKPAVKPAVKSEKASKPAKTATAAKPDTTAKADNSVKSGSNAGKQSVAKPAKQGSQQGAEAKSDRASQHHGTAKSGGSSRQSTGQSKSQ